MNEIIIKRSFKLDSVCESTKAKQNQNPNQNQGEFSKDNFLFPSSRFRFFGAKESEGQRSQREREPKERWARSQREGSRAEAVERERPRRRN